MADGFGPFLQPGIPSRMIPCRGYAGAFAVLGQRLRLTADCRMRNGRFRLLRPSPLCQSTRTISRISGTESSFPLPVSVPPPPIFSPGLSVSPHPSGCVTADVVSWPGRCVFVFGLSWFRGRSAVFSRPAVGGGPGKVLFPAERLRSGGVELGEGPSLSALGFLFRLSALPPGAASILRVDCPVAE